MLRILLLIIITYIVIRIALRLLLTESPGQRRSRVKHGQYDPRDASSSPYGFGHGNASGRNGKTGRESEHGRFDHIEDAEFEEIPRDASRDKK